MLKPTTKEQGKGAEFQEEFFLSTEEGKQFEKALVKFQQAGLLLPGEEETRDTIRGILNLVRGDTRRLKAMEDGTISIGIPEPDKPFAGIFLKLDAITSSAEIKMLIDRYNRLDLGTHSIIQIYTDGERLILSRRGTLPGTEGLKIEFTPEPTVEFKFKR